MQFINTLTRTKEEFVPMDAANVRMYVCGVTPYDDSHIGHARAYVVADVLFRLLRHTYGDDHVTYVRNFTDVDDKIIERANERGLKPADVAETYIKSFHNDMDALNCLRPTHEPRVTDPVVMQGIVDFILKLEGKGAAYVLEGDGVYLDTTKIDGGSEYTYGQLSRKKMEDLIAGARVEANTKKRNTGDFALWKLAKPGEPFWASPWGNGRPGWHIECSVMSAQLLGERFDIHGGGEDLQFPHHENELAQSVACTGHIHANTWIHNAFITVGGTKMSKSLNNFTTIKDVLAKYSPEAIRLWLLQTHYRKPVDYSEEALMSAEISANYFFKVFSKITLEEDLLASYLLKKGNYRPIDAVSHSLMQDMNTSESLYALRNITEGLTNFLISNKYRRGIRFIETIADVKYNALLLGLDLSRKNADAYFRRTKKFSKKQKEAMYSKILQRYQAIQENKWDEADKIRDGLLQNGIILEDHPDGTITWRRE